MSSPSHEAGTRLAIKADVRRRVFRARAGSDHGFTMAEILVVVAIMSIVLGMTLGWFRAAKSTLDGDADLRTVMGQVKLARETAINQRRAIELQFTMPNIIRVVRRNIPSGTTIISSAVLEHNMQFMLFSSIPDTPDGFGKNTATYFGGQSTYMFTSDGMFTDVLGNPLSGTIFIAKNPDQMTARAVTIFGPSARIRSYRWNGSAWK